MKHTKQILHNLFYIITINPASLAGLIAASGVKVFLGPTLIFVLSSA